MGGLIARHYIHQFMPPSPQDGRPQIAHLVMLGTPNMGSPCADVMNTTFEMLGKNVEAVSQLRQDVAADFNRVNINRKGRNFRFSPATRCRRCARRWSGMTASCQCRRQYGRSKTTRSPSNLHTDLTGTADFSSFVKPRLAIGPKGNHNPEMPDIQAFRPMHQVPRMIGVSYRPDSENVFAEMSAASQNKDFARAVTVKPRETVEIRIPIVRSENVGLTFMASPILSVRLFDQSGTLIGENIANSPASRGYFRSLFVNKKVEDGVWVLKVENPSDFEHEIIVTMWNNAVK